MDTLILGIVGSIIATAIICIARKLFQWFPKPSISNIQLNKVILISSIFISTLVFVFGNILEPAVLWLFEPDKINYNFGKIYLKQFPQYFFLSLFLASRIPGIITGYCCTIGRSLSQRIWFASISAIISLSIFDFILFFVHSSFLTQPKILLYFNINYFSLLSNIFGGPIAGLIIGSTTHFLANLFLTDSQI